MNYIDKANKWKNYSSLDKNLKDELFNMNDDELKEAFTTDLEFGTGGLRGILGAGTNRMNIYIVRKATLGFGRYLSKFPNAYERGVAISHDNRHFSRIFAIESAKVLTKMGFHVYLFEDLRPTPELSFSVRENHAIGGIMITASHNPKEYNGYKIYDEFGCQLLPDAANKVIEEIEGIDDYFNIPVSKDLENVTMMGREMDEIYIHEIKKIVTNKNYKKDFKIVYTPLHGTGQVFAPEVLKSLGYDVYPVKEQMTPDPNFSNVKTSNPENKEAYDEGIMLAKNIGAKLVLATDPDADRLGVAVLHNGDYVLMTGNQSATVIFNYLLTRAHENHEDLSNSYLFTTIVSSDLPVLMAKKNHMKYDLTLTGFKFIGAKAREIENKSKYFFGFEESYGCLISDSVRDKDSIQACMMLCEAASYYYEKNMDLIDALNEIYDEYGYFDDSITNIKLEGLEGQEKIKSIMNYFRENEITLKDFTICEKDDILLDEKRVGNEISKTNLPKSNVIKYFLTDGSWFVLRPSGTEPKLKVYYQIRANSKSEASNKMALLKNEVLEILNKLK